MPDSPAIYAMYRRPNSAILTDVATGQDPLPTLGELKPLGFLSSGLYDGWRLLLKPLVLPNGDFMTSVVAQGHLNSRLAYPSPSSHDVFLVARPDRWTINPSGSFKHWSFYCQGHFYHLSAPGLRRGVVERSQNASKSQGVQCKLNHEDWSDLDSGEWRGLQEIERRRPLMACKVGQTDYRPDQILQIASWVVDQLPSYDLFDANCQHFVKAVVSMTVMRLCDRTVFIGSRTQVVDWSLGRGNQPHVNGLERGFIIAPPLPVHMSRLQMFKLQFKSALKVQGYINHARIKIMYEEGPDTSRAKSPKYQIKEAMRLFKLDMTSAKKELYEGCAEFKEDILQKRWKDALLGRRKKQRDGTIRRPWQTRPKMNNTELADSENRHRLLIEDTVV